MSSTWGVVADLLQPWLLLLPRDRSSHTHSTQCHPSSKTRSKTTESHPLRLLMLHPRCDWIGEDLSATILRQQGVSRGRRWAGRTRADHKGSQRCQLGRDGGCGEVSRGMWRSLWDGRADGVRQLQEFGSKYESETLRNSKRLDMADVIVYVHDSSDTNSFSYISNLRVSLDEFLIHRSTDGLQQQYSLDHIPAIFVATKSDLDLAQQRHEVQPDVYSRRLGLPAPMAVSARTGPSAVAL